MRKLTALLVLALVAPALAAPAFKETLTRADREKIVKAIQAKLPPVDKAAVAKCQTMLDAFNKAPETSGDKLPEIGKCLRDAGSLGAAIQMWKMYVMKGKEGAAKRDVTLDLAKAYEAAGMFYEAAETYEKFAKKYGDKKAGAGELTRSICIRRQIGDVDAVTQQQKLLLRMFKVTTDPDALCASIRPIAMP